MSTPMASVVERAGRGRGRAVVLIGCATFLSLAGDRAVLAHAPQGARASERPVRLVSVRELRSWQREGRDFALVDARPARVCEVWRIDGAACMPYEELATRLGELPKGKDVVVYGQAAGERDRAAADAGRLLARSGFAEVYELDGGVIAFASDVDSANGQCCAGFG